MKRVKLYWFLGLVVLLALPAGSVMAAPTAPVKPFDRILTGGDYVLEAGDTERGDVVVFGGSAKIETDAVLDGDLTVFGGSAKVDGTVEGSVVVFGGGVELTENATIGGDCVLIGGSVDIDEKATIEGDVVDNPESRWLPFGSWNDGEWSWNPRRGTGELPLPTPRVPEMPLAITRVVHHSGPSFAGRVGGAFLSALGLGIAALLITLFWPKQVDRVRQVVVREPVMSGLVGFLTLLAAGLMTPILMILSAVLILLLCLGLLGFPLIALLWLVIVAGCLVGWAGIGQLAGHWLVNRLNLQGTSSMLESGLGAFTVSLVLGVAGVIPLIGIGAGLLNFVLVCIGLGAVVLTRFGRQDYWQGQPILPRRSAKPPAAAATEVPVQPGAPPPPPAPLAPAPAAPADRPEVGSRFDVPPLDAEGPFPEQ